MDLTVETVRFFNIGFTSLKRFPGQGKIHGERTTKVSLRYSVGGKIVRRNSFPVIVSTSIAARIGAVLAQRGAITIAVGSHVKIPLGAQISADTIYVYGTLDAADLTGIFAKAKVYCCGACIPTDLPVERGFHALRASVGNMPSGMYNLALRAGETCLS